MVTVHGLGAAIEKSINLVLALNDIMQDQIIYKTTTNTVQLIDDIMPDDDDKDLEIQTRCNSSICIQISLKDDVKKYVIFFFYTVVWSNNDDSQTWSCSVLSKLITTATTKTLSSKPYQQSPLNPKRSDKPESLKTSLPPITIRARSGSSSNVIESNNIRKSAINRNRSNSTNTLNNSNSTLIGGGTRRIPGSASSTKGNTGSRGGDGVKGINTLGRSRSSSNSSASSSGSILKKKVIKPTRDTVLGII
ncbi:10151_t:CDS:2 [Entrophospora sp. SA101]|nr:10151_t:CDS:2 [Entrophospora sp. SA101]